MKHLLFIVLAMLHPASAWAQESGYEKELKPVSFLVGTFEGKGESAYSPYAETTVAEWGVGKTIITLRTRSSAGGRTLFEDLRVFSYDNEARKIRMRQYANGNLAEYDVVVSDGGNTLVFNQTSREGLGRPAWRYTLTRDGDAAYSYIVEAKRDGTFSEFAKGSLARKAPDTGRMGLIATAHFMDRVPWKKGGDSAAQIHYPKDGKGPFPTIVFSPGGQAATAEGYEGFARRFASWGYVTVIVAFDTDTAAERAGLFSETLDWLKKKNQEEGWRLKGKIDTTRFVASGHSRGGQACIIAAKKEKRFVACVALAPSGPDKLDGDHSPALCLISGDQGDKRISSALFDEFDAPKVQVTIEGMDHFFQPSGKSLFVGKYAIAFMNYRVKGDARYKLLFTQKEAGITLRLKE